MGLDPPRNLVTLRVGVADQRYPRSPRLLIPTCAADHERGWLHSAAGRAAGAPGFIGRDNLVPRDCAAGGAGFLGIVHTPTWPFLGELRRDRDPGRVSETDRIPITADRLLKHVHIGTLRSGRRVPLARVVDDLGSNCARRKQSSDQGPIPG
jgi:hypothetical protein